MNDLTPSPKVGQIRILELFPCSELNRDITPIKCELNLVDLVDKPRYEAISYRWGEKTDTTTITVSDKPVVVTRTLEACLRTLRRTSESRFLWVDQLCINQDDNEEKIRQVRMMDVIYSSCSQCVIWLGHGQEQTPDLYVEYAFELFQYIADPNKVPHPKAFNSTEEFKQTMQVVEWMSVHRHPWWRRVWTLQEAVLPQHKIIVLGNHFLSWQVLVQAAYARLGGYWEGLWWRMKEYTKDRIATEDDQLDQLLLHAQWTEQTLKQRDPQQTLFSALLIWREKRFATDPADQIFGYMGLVPASDLAHTHRCDYNTSPGHVFNALTIDLIMLYGLAPLLMNPRAKTGTRTENTANWAMDLAGEVVYTIDYFYMWWSDGHYNACGDRPLDTERVLHAANQSEGKFDVLHLHGFKADTISHVHGQRNIRPKQTPLRDTAAIFTVLRQWLAFAKQHIGPNSSDEGKINRDFARFMLGDLVRNNEMWVERRPTDDDIGDVVTGLLREDFSYNVARLWPRAASFYSQVCNQNFIVTQRGLFGVGHLETEVGDEIWILEGGRMPFVLRKQPDGNGHDFVGFCYIQGLMFGEFFRGENVPGVAEEVRVY